jgi:hypothetical protein
VLVARTEAEPPLPLGVLAPLLAFLVWAFACAVASGRGLSAFMGEPTNLLGWLALAALLSVALAAAALSDEVARALGVVAPAVLALELAFAFSQVLTRQPVRGTLPNSTYLGELVVLLLPFVALRPEVVPPRAADLHALGGVAVLAAGGSRVAALAAGVWLIVEHVPRLARSVRKRVLYALGAVASAVAGALLFAREEVFGSFSPEAWGERPLMWSDAWRATLARPVLGFGPDGFVAGGASVSTVERMQHGPVLVYRLYGAVDPHSAIAWIAVSTGLVGLALTVWSGVEVVRAWRAAPLPAHRRAAVWAVCMVAAVLLTAPLVMQVAPVLALVAGVSLPRAPASRAGLGRRAWAWLLAALCLASAAFAAGALVRLPFEVPDQERSLRVAAPAARAAALVRADPYLWYLASQHLGWGVRAGTVSAAERPDLAAAMRASELDRRSPFYALEAARTLVFYDAPASDVDAAYAEVFRRWPAFPLAHAERAHYLASTGRVQEAVREAAVARAFKGDDPEVAAALRAVEEILKN